jgi:hypothetical protein
MFMFPATWEVEIEGSQFEASLASFPTPPKEPKLLRLHLKEQAEHGGTYP